MQNKKKETSQSIIYSQSQHAVLIALRLGIGWHFLYEGITKLLNPYWSSAGYLMESQGLFSALFKSIAAFPSVLQIVDIINIWALIVIGLFLILGLFSRLTALCGAILLFLYYVCQPPFTGYMYTMPAEGNYLVVNKILIEMLALIILFYFSSSHVFGLDYFIKKYKDR